MQAFGGPGGVHHVVESVSRELLHELLLGRKIKFDEMNAPILQILARAVSAHGGPSLKSLGQSFLHNETANEPTGTGNENLHQALT